MAATGHLFFNGVDAWTRYGIILASNGLSVLMTPPALKEWITNEVRDENGTRYVKSAAPKLAERSLVLPIQLCAKTEAEFAQKYALFCNEILAGGVINIATQWEPNKVYKCVYQSCSQFTQFLQQIATFGLQLVEPNPADRTVVTQQTANE